MGWPLTGSVFPGMMPGGGGSPRGRSVAPTLGDGAAKDGAPERPTDVRAPAPDMWLVTVTAMRPGRMTRKGKNIFGMAAMRGTRRAETSESAAMARWMTRESGAQG